MKMKFLSLLMALVCSVATMAQKNPKMSYSEQWNKIENLKNKERLPQSAMKEVQKLYQAALQEKEYGQVVKAIIYRMDLQSETQENVANGLIDSLRKDLVVVPQPAKSIVYSLLGDVYKNFFQSNRWQLMNRSNTSIDDDDIYTWDIQKLYEAALDNYHQSIEEERILQQTPLKDYEILLSRSDNKYSEIVYPSLFDFLAKRTISMLESEIGVARPQEMFVINKAVFFEDGRTFSNRKIETNDTLSVNYQTLRIYQRILKYHLELTGKEVVGEMLQVSDKLNESVCSLIHWDLDRIRFVYNQGNYADKDAEYEKALKGMEKNYAQFPDKIVATYWLAQLYKTQGEKWRSEKKEHFRCKYMEAYNISTQLIEQNPRHYIVSSARSLQQEITAPAVQITLSNIQNPNSPVLALVQYRNINKIELSYYKVNDDFAYENHNYSFDFDKLKNKEIFKKQLVDLPLGIDYQSYSTEIKLDELPQGNYIIVARDGSGTIKNEDFYTSAFFQVSSLIMTIRSHQNDSEVSRYMVAYNPQVNLKNVNGVCELNIFGSKTGEPLHKAKVEIYTQNWVSSRNKYVERLEATYYTDEKGIAYIADWNRSNGHFRKAVITHQNNRLTVFDWNANFGWYNRGTYQNLTIFTDRSIYRPGQTVFYKGILFQTDKDENKSLLPNVPVSIALMDVNRKSIASENLVTNEYGSIQGSFVIPQGLLNGQMIIQSNNGSVTIQVEEYKRPTFEVKFDPVRQNYKLNSDIEVTGSAKALAGYAVDNSKIQYRILRSVRYRYFGWWFPHIQESSREIASGELKTDNKGAFTIRFNAEADDVKNNHLIYDYSVTADITDVNGETRSATLNLPVSNKPLLIVSNLPERITDRKKLGFNLSTTNLNGDLTPADVEINITALQSPERLLRNRLWALPDTFTLSRSEFESYFPFDPYGDEDNAFTYPELKKTGSLQIRTTDDVQLSTAKNQIDLKMLASCNPGWYRIQIKAKNDEGVEVEEIRLIQLMAEPGSKPIQHMKDWVTVIKNTGEPGENAEFAIAGGAVQSQIRYEILFRDQVVKQEILQVGTTPQQIRVPIKEEYRGGFAIQFVMVHQGRTYTSLNEISVPYTPKMLDISFTTFRDKLLPGEKEKWTLSVKNKKGEKEMAEMVASLYDASLDYFRSHDWRGSNSFYPMRNHSAFAWRTTSYTPIISSQYYRYYEYKANLYSIPLVYLANYGNYMHSLYTYGYGRKSRMQLRGAVSDFASGAVMEESMESLALPAPPMAAQAPAEMKDQAINQELNKPKATAGFDGSSEGGAVGQMPLDEIATRENFNETAFFYPQLRTNEEGEVIIDFTIPEALTRWKMLGFAHTKDLKVGSITNELITQKQVAISANAPRFFRENDVIEFTAKVNNITEGDLSGQAMLRLYDATTMQPVDAQALKSKQTQSFEVKAGESAGLVWKLAIPSGIQAITYKVTAQAGTHTDGEEKMVPVMNNSMLVTETMPFSVRGGQEKTFTFHKLEENQSNTLRNHKLTLEFTSNPAWYAVQAMPYLMEYPYECAEQTFSRFYANSLASTIVNSTPRIKQIFEQWSTMPENKNALLSNLEKNQELKQVMLEETPWVMQAENETERKKHVGLLFDLNKMSNELRRAFEKVKKAQQSNGGFGWFDGLPPSRFMTQHILAKMEHLKKLNALSEEYTSDATRMTQSGLSFLSLSIKKDYDELLKVKNVKLEDQHVDATQLHYLYTCSFSKHKPSNAGQLKAFDYYYKQAEKYWMNFSIYNQALIALTMHRYGNNETAGKIIKSLKERSQQSEEMGMYWKDNVAGYFWYQAPIETQALLIETFHEVSEDVQAVEEMKIWLLRMKQTTDWGTTKATSEACYALLMTGGRLLDESAILEVKLGGKPLTEIAREEIRPEAGTGYVKTSWNDGDIHNEMAVVDVINPNEQGIAWGGVYWQYFEQLDKITSAVTNLNMTKQLFLRKITPKGEVLEPLNEKNVLKVGDLVKVRMELRADRDFEYVHLKDMRAAGFEPVSTLSGHRYQGGLWYYESIKDASTNFFITYLLKGTYVFEYELRATHAGNFSNGITTFQCMYAPEFSSHSEGVRVKVEAQ